MVPGLWALNTMLCTLQGETDLGCGLGFRLLFETGKQTTSTRKATPWELDAWKGAGTVSSLCRNLARAGAP